MAGAERASLSSARAGDLPARVRPPFIRSGALSAGGRRASSELGLRADTMRTERRPDFHMLALEIGARQLACAAAQPRRPLARSLVRSLRSFALLLRILIERNKANTGLAKPAHCLSLPTRTTGRLLAVVSTT